MDFKKDKRKIQVQQQVFHLLVDIVEMYPQYSFSQHLLHILRKKGDSKEKDKEELNIRIDELKGELN